MYKKLYRSYFSKAEMLTNRKYTFKAKASCKAEVDQKFLNFSHFLYLHSSGTRGLNQNLHWKLGQQTPSFESLSACLDNMAEKKILHRNKTFFFFKIESWNFQVQFEIEYRETSQNFNSIRQPIYKM